MQWLAMVPWREGCFQPRPYRLYMIHTLALLGALVTAIIRVARICAAQRTFTFVRSLVWRSNNDGRYSASKDNIMWILFEEAIDKLIMAALMLMLTRNACLPRRLSPLLPLAMHSLNPLSPLRLPDDLQL